ncbi:MAG TPA: hypothetical protein VNJ04_12540 [Gemmatimonadaceae bacterium]|nr:hypothetical protein [Gemmatimonadaceae bacterium]
MAVRDFVDEKGVPWKVWPVTPESFKTRTAAEDYLGDYGGGWLCFESGSERRRLAQFPRDWSIRSDKDLSALLKTAAVVTARTPAKTPVFRTGPGGT